LNSKTKNSDVLRKDTRKQGAGKKLAGKKCGRPSSEAPLKTGPNLNRKREEETSRSGRIPKARHACRI